MRMTFACVDRLRIKWSKDKKVMTRRTKMSSEPDCLIITAGVLQDTENMTVSSGK